MAASQNGRNSDTPWRPVTGWRDRRKGARRCILFASYAAVRRRIMDDRVSQIRAEDINPRFNWGRALPALGTMGVDFEARVDCRRMRRYRLKRVRQVVGYSVGARLW